MKTIIITHPEFIEGEIEQIINLFESGLELLHLRKPASTVERYEGYVKQIPQRYYSRIVVHEYFELIDSYKLRGAHLNKRHPQYEGYGRISKSCHALNELKDIENFDYVFLSPLFDSISKTDYRSAFSRHQLAGASSEGLINSKVIALGGIDDTNYKRLIPYGFGGVALLGYIWQNPDPDKVKLWKKIK